MDANTNTNDQTSGTPVLLQQKTEVKFTNPRYNIQISTLSPTRYKPK